MKKRFLTTLFVLFGTICFGQNYAIKSEGVESVVADYAKEIIDKNIIVKTGYEYELVLSQNGDSFSVSYVVNPGNMAGQESTDDLWNEIEQTITRALNAMNKQIDNAIMAQKQAENQKSKKQTVVEKKEDKAAEIKEEKIVENNDEDAAEEIVKYSENNVEPQKKSANDKKQTNKINLSGNFMNNKSDKMFLGVNAGLGFGLASYEIIDYYYDYWGNYYSYYGYESSAYLALNVGADFTYKIMNSLSVGGFLSLGLDSDYCLAASFGPMVKYDLKYDNAIIGGIGLNIADFNELGVSLRAGYKLPSDLYFFAEMTTASYSYSYSAISFMVHVGYTIFK